MFGRRRHAAVQAPAAPAPRLTDAQILELVHSKVGELIGENGEWTVSRRSADDTDTIFHSVLAQSVSVGITAAIVEARNRLEAGEGFSAPQHLAAPRADLPAAPAQVTADAEAPAAAADVAVADTFPVEESAEPAAFGWEPAPITVWTDLRKPVTGEFPLVSERSAA